MPFSDVAAPSIGNSDIIMTPVMHSFQINSNSVKSRSNFPFIYLKSLNENFSSYYKANGSICLQKDEKLIADGISICKYIYFPGPRVEGSVWCLSRVALKQIRSGREK